MPKKRRNRKRKLTNKQPVDSKTRDSKPTGDLNTKVNTGPKGPESSSEARKKINNLLPEDYENQILTASAKPEENAEGNEALYGCVKLAIKTKEDALVWINKFERKTFTSYRTQQYWTKAKAGVFMKQFRCICLDEEGLSFCKACLTMTVKDAEEIDTDPDLGKFPTQVTIEFNHNHKINSEAYLKKLNCLRQLKSSFHTYFANGHSSMSAHILHRCDLHSLYGPEFYQIVTEKEVCPTYNWCLREYNKFTSSNSVKDRITIDEAVTSYNNKHLGKYAVLLHKNEILAISTPLMKSVFHMGFGDEAITVRIFLSPKNIAVCQNIILFLCHTPIGTLPIGVIIALSNNEDYICNGIKALVDLFGMSYNPNTIISDESPLISKCLKKCFPKSQLVFNQFRLLQWAWRMLRSICANDEEDFQILYNLFEVTLNSPTKEKFDESFNRFVVYVQEFPKLSEFLEYFKSRAESYVSYACPKINISNHIFSYTDSGTIILQDIFTKYAQYFNTLLLFDFLTKNYVQHYQRKLEKIVNGDLKGFFKTNFYIPLNKIINNNLTCQEINDTEYLLSFDNGKSFFVNTELDTCTCQTTVKAGSCVHQYIIDNHCGLVPECYTPLHTDMLDIFKSVLNSIKSMNTDSCVVSESLNESADLLLLNNDESMDAFDEINLAISFKSFSEANEEDFFSDTGQYNKESEMVRNFGSKEENLIIDSAEAENSNMDFAPKELWNLNITDSKINAEVEISNITSSKNITVEILNSENFPNEVENSISLKNSEIKTKEVDISNTINSVNSPHENFSNEVENSCSRADYEIHSGEVEIPNSENLNNSNSITDYESLPKELGISDAGDELSNIPNSENLYGIPLEEVETEEAEVSNITNASSSSFTDNKIPSEEVEPSINITNSEINAEEIEISNIINSENILNNSKSIIDHEILAQELEVSYAGDEISNIPNSENPYGIPLEEIKTEEAEVTNMTNAELGNSSSCTDNEVPLAEAEPSINITNSENNLNNSKSVIDHEILAQELEVSYAGDEISKILNSENPYGIPLEEVKTEEAEVSNITNAKLGNSSSCIDNEIALGEAEPSINITNSENNLNNSKSVIDHEILAQELQVSYAGNEVSNIPNSKNLYGIPQEEIMTEEADVSNIANAKLGNSNSCTDNKIPLAEAEPSINITNSENNLNNSKSVIDHEILAQELQVSYAGNEVSNIPNSKNLYGISQEEIMTDEAEVSNIANAKLGNSSSFTDNEIPLAEAETSINITNSENNQNNSKSVIDHEILAQELEISYAGNEISNIPNSENPYGILLEEVKIEEADNITNSESLSYKAEILNSNSLTDNETLLGEAEPSINITSKINAEEIEISNNTSTVYEILVQEVEISNITNSENLYEIPLEEIKTEEAEVSNITNSESLLYEVENSNNLTDHAIFSEEAEISNNITNSKVSAEEIKISNITDPKLLHEVEIPNAEVGNTESLTNDEILSGEAQILNNFTNAEITVDLETSNITKSENHPTEVDNSNFIGYENLQEAESLSNITNPQEEAEISNFNRNTEVPQEEFEDSNKDYEFVSEEFKNSKSLTDHKILLEEAETSNFTADENVQEAETSSNITNSQISTEEAEISDFNKNTEVPPAKFGNSNVMCSEDFVEDYENSNTVRKSEIVSDGINHNFITNSNINAKEIETSNIINFENLPIEVKNSSSLKDYEISQEDAESLKNITNSQIPAEEIKISNFNINSEVLAEEFEYSNKGALEEFENLKSLTAHEIISEEAEISNFTADENIKEAESSSNITNYKFPAEKAEISGFHTNSEVPQEEFGYSNKGYKCASEEFKNLKSLTDHEILSEEAEISSNILTYQFSEEEAEISNFNTNTEVPQEEFKDSNKAYEFASEEFENSKILTDHEIFSEEAEISSNITNYQFFAEKAEISDFQTNSEVPQKEFEYSNKGYKCASEEFKNLKSLTDHEILSEEAEISSNIINYQFPAEEAEISNFNTNAEVPQEEFKDLNKAYEFASEEFENSKILTDHEIISEEAEISSNITNYQFPAEKAEISDFHTNSEIPQEEFEYSNKGYKCASEEFKNLKSLTDHEILSEEADISSNIINYQFPAEEAVISNFNTNTEVPQEEFKDLNKAYEFASEEFENSKILTDHEIISEEAEISNFTADENVQEAEIPSNITNYQIQGEEAEISNFITNTEVPQEEFEDSNETYEFVSEEFKNSKSFTDHEIQSKEAEISSFTVDENVQKAVISSNITNYQFPAEEAEISNFNANTEIPLEEFENSRSLTDHEILSEEAKISNFTADENVQEAEISSNITNYQFPAAAVSNFITNTEIPQEEFENSKSLTDHVIISKAAEILNFTVDENVQEAEISSNIANYQFSAVEDEILNFITNTEIPQQEFEYSNEDYEYALNEFENSNFTFSEDFVEDYENSNIVRNSEIVPEEFDSSYTQNSEIPFKESKEQVNIVTLENTPFPYASTSEIDNQFDYYGAGNSQIYKEPTENDQNEIGEKTSNQMLLDDIIPTSKTKKINVISSLIIRPKIENRFLKMDQIIAKTLTNLNELKEKELATNDFDWNSPGKKYVKLPRNTEESVPKSKIELPESNIKSKNLPRESFKTKEFLSLHPNIEKVQVKSNFKNEIKSNYLPADCSNVSKPLQAKSNIGKVELKSGRELSNTGFHETMKIKIQQLSNIKVSDSDFNLSTYENQESDDECKEFQHYSDCDSNCSDYHSELEPIASSDNDGESSDNDKNLNIEKYFSKDSDSSGKIKKFSEKTYTRCNKFVEQDLRKLDETATRVNNRKRKMSGDANGDSPSIKRRAQLANCNLPTSSQTLSCFNKKSASLKKQVEAGNQTKQSHNEVSPKTTPCEPFGAKRNHGKEKSEMLNINNKSEIFSAITGQLEESGKLPKRSQNTQLEILDFDRDDSPIKLMTKMPKERGNPTQRPQKKHSYSGNEDSIQQSSRKQPKRNCKQHVHLEYLDPDSESLDSASEYLDSDSEYFDTDSEDSIQKRKQPKKKLKQHVHSERLDFDSGDLELKAPIEKLIKRRTPPKIPQIEHSSAYPVLFTKTENVEKNLIPNVDAGIKSLKQSTILSKDQQNKFLSAITNPFNKFAHFSALNNINSKICTTKEHPQKSRNELSDIKKPPERLKNEPSNTIISSEHLSCSYFDRHELETISKSGKKKKIDM